MRVDFTKYDEGKAKDLAKKFGSATLTEMMMNIQEMDLVDRAELLHSLKFSVHSKNKEVDRIAFSYEWYGKIQEMGSDNLFGKGVKIDPRKWRSEAIDNNIDSLNEEFAKFYAELIIEEINIDEIKIKI
jgi:hypothetical protein